MKSPLARVILLALADALPPTLCALAAMAACAYGAGGTLPGSTPATAWPALALYLATNAAAGLYRGGSLQTTAIFSHVRDMRRLFATLTIAHAVLAGLLWRQNQLHGPLALLLPLGWLLSCLAAMPTRRLMRQLSGSTQRHLCPEDILRDVCQCPPQRGRHRRVLKTVLEGILAILALLCCWPLLLLIAAAVKITSPGPVIYRARRLGKDGQPICVWKFRTMYQHADERLHTVLAHNPALADEWQRRQKLDHDPRVTPLGRFLRRSSLDELPQLVNVLQGDMAVIGPRPIVDDEVARYGEFYPIFASVKPGITGLWQVSGRNQLSYPTRVALDVAYVNNWSIWLDLYILQKTALEILRGKGS